MQLDQARIAIHERGWGENLDLALHVLRSHVGPLALCGLAIIGPLAVANHWLVDLTRADSFDDSPSGSVYLWLVMLVLIETPLATALVTLYLGQALFVERPPLRKTLRAFVSCLPQVLLLGVASRVALIPPLVTWIVPFGLWPYLNEVILLERNPLTSRGGRVSTLKRNSQLHRGASSEFMWQALLSLCVAGLLTLAIYLTETFLVRNLLGLESDWTMLAVQWQIALWLVAVFFTVARFLCYLDQRIRCEGWEVELSLRAERDRMTRHPA